MAPAFRSEYQMLSRTFPNSNNRVYGHHPDLLAPRRGSVSQKLLLSSPTELTCLLVASEPWPHQCPLSPCYMQDIYAGYIYAGSLPYRKDARSSPACDHRMWWRTRSSMTRSSHSGTWRVCARTPLWAGPLCTTGPAFRLSRAGPGATQSPATRRAL